MSNGEQRVGIWVCLLLISVVRQSAAVVLLGDCSADPASCEAGLVCDTGDNTCRVKADGTATDCTNDNGNCPSDATCATTVCNCISGFIDDGTGLCTVQDADCSGGTACGDTTNYVCDTTNNLCKVKADDTATTCASSNANCANHATCSSTTCSCDAGYIHDGTGLCTVQNAVCSGGTACGDTTNYVCDTTNNLCKVKADGSASTCASDNANCANHATCSSTTCSCEAGYIHDGTGLCTVQNAVCSGGTACGDTTNYVCDTTNNLCKVKADGSASTCASDNANCANHATCSTTTCSCDAGFLNDGTGLCTVQNAVCSGGTACGETTNYVCDTSNNQCKVKADGSATNCASTTGNCPNHATCATTICNCDSGYVDDGTGLCIDVQDADCSGGKTCGSNTDYVCDTSSNQCKVKADGTATTCASSNANCASHATCSSTTCSCDAGYINDGTGLCTVQNAVCSGGTACGDTTNYVCDTSNNLCKVKADGSSSSCSSTDTNCVSNAACSSTTCSCSTGYTAAAGSTGLCVAIIDGITCGTDADCTALDTNSECDAGTSKCACVSGYAGSAGDTCQANDGTSLTTSGMGIYLGILLFCYILS